MLPILLFSNCKPKPELVVFLFVINLHQENKIKAHVQSLFQESSNAAVGINFPSKNYLSKNIIITKAGCNISREVVVHEV
nr:hypothetical protein Iba_chr08dCG10170 [Ipomoea batatas]GMD28081.1 hypothetical protein Iba_chr08eCG3980 [Ipomoea batatas]